MILLTGLTGVTDIIVLLLLIVLILVAAYFTTKWIGKAQVYQGRNRNLAVVETLRLSPNHHIQIVRVADQYLVIGVSKENVTLLTTLKLDELKELDKIEKYDFHQLLNKLTNKSNKDQVEVGKDEK